MSYFAGFVLMYLFIGLMCVIGNYYISRRKFVKQLNSNDTDEMLRYKYEKAFEIYSEYVPNIVIIFVWPQCLFNILAELFSKKEEKYIQKVLKEKFPESNL